MQKYVFFFNNHFICFTPSLFDKYSQDNRCEKVIYPELVNNDTFNSFFSVLNRQNWIVVYGSEFKKILKYFLKNIEIVRAGGGVVVNQMDMILFIYRNHKWDLPKGKAEQGENIRETSLREVKEECGLQRIEINKYICRTYHIYQYENKFILKKTYWFEMSSKIAQELKPQEEEGITKVEWMNREQINSKVYENTYENIRHLIDTYFDKTKKA